VAFVEYVDRSKLGFYRKKTQDSRSGPVLIEGVSKALCMVSTGVRG
jgi:hypothetical protein